MDHSDNSDNPDNSGQAPSPAQLARAMLKTLQERFPVFRDCQPLAIGIDKQLRKRHPELERKILRVALGMHTHSLHYLKNMEKAEQRLDLDGNAVAEVPEEHRQHATEILRERSRKRQEWRKEQAQEQRLAAAREQEERQRTEKLNQLVERFGKSR